MASCLSVESIMDQVMIIGAGLGGTAAALGLARLGVKVRVFEQAAHFDRIGAGLAVAPSVQRALDYLGVGGAFDAALGEPQPLRFLDYRTGSSVFTTTEANPLDLGHLAAVRRVHRADLHDILTTALLAIDPDAIVLGAELQSFEQDVSGVTAHFVKGDIARADLMIGADGVRSITRRILTGPDNAHFTGYVAWRIVAPIETVEAYVDSRFADITIGPNANFTTYRVSHGRSLNVVALARTSAWQEEGWRIPATVEELQFHFRDWNANVLGIIGAAPPGRLFKWALFGRPPLPSWTAGRVMLLGDSAHPVLPFLGMGAGLAIEDAVVLARYIEQDFSTAAFRRYQDARIPRTTQIQEASRRQGEVFDQIPSPASMTQSPMLRPEIFGYDPVTSPI